MDTIKQNLNQQVGGKLPTFNSTMDTIKPGGLVSPFRVSALF